MAKEDKTIPQKEEIAPTVSIDTLCDICGLNSLDRNALKKKFGKEEKSIVDWKDSLKNDIVFNN